MVKIGQIGKYKKMDFKVLGIDVNEFHQIRVVRIFKNGMLGKQTFTAYDRDIQW